MAKRATMHNGRSGKDGVYSPKHNDRSFDISKSDHIDQNKTKFNIVANSVNSDLNFEQAEREFYQKTFKEGLDAANQRYISNRHKDRVRTMDQYRTAPRTCPEETIWQIGDKDTSVDPDTLMQVVQEQLIWQNKKYPNCQILDIALHVDEQGAPHIHDRHVWIGHDKDGNAIAAQDAALREMGVPLPHPDKPRGRYNNRKMTFTRDCREHFIKLCCDHGLEIDVEPREATKSGLALTEYKRQQEQAKIDALARQNAQIAEKRNKLDVQCKKTLNDLYEANTALQRQKEQAAATIDDLNRQIGIAQESLQTTMDMQMQVAEIKIPSLMRRALHMAPQEHIYDQHSVNALKRIGEDARQHLSDAQTERSDAYKTLKEAKRLAAEVEGMRQQAAADRSEAAAKLKAINDYISQTAAEVAKEEISRYTDINDRLKDYINTRPGRTGKSIMAEFTETLLPPQRRMERTKSKTRHFYEDYER